MDEATILRMDGEALTRLAYALGLAPPEAWETVGGAIDAGASDGSGLLWTPHLNFIQADVLFRQLRTLGWWTDVQGDAYEGFARATAGDTVIAVCWPRPETPTEMLAQLRCAVLALAVTGQRLWQGEEEGQP